MTVKLFLGLDTVLLKRIAELATLSMIVGIAIALAEVSWFLIPQAALPKVTDFEAVSSIALDREEQQLALGQEQAISRWHLFGIVSRPVKIVSPKPVKRPRTKLNLTLRGVIASNNMAEARAIIGDRSRQEDVYGVGDTLPGQATLIAIHQNRVVLQFMGREEILFLPREGAGGDNLRATPLSWSPANSPRGFKQKTKQPPLREIRKKILANPLRASEFVRMNAVRQQGQFMGYRLRPGKKKGLLAAYNLQPGDIVRAVNGIELTSPSTGINLLPTLSVAKTVMLDVERRGQRQQVSLTIE